MAIPNFNLDAFRQGKEAQFTIVYNRFFRPLLYVAKEYMQDHAEANLCVSKAFMSLWGGRAGIKNERHLNNYLFLATRHECLNHVDSNRRRQFNLNKPTIDEDIALYYEDTVIREAEFLNKLEWEIRRLPKNERDTLLAIWHNNETIDEIAQRTGKKPNAVRSAKRQALKKIKIDFLKVFLVITTLEALSVLT